MGLGVIALGLLLTGLLSTLYIQRLIYKKCAVIEDRFTIVQYGLQNEFGCDWQIKECENSNDLNKS